MSSYNSKYTGAEVEALLERIDEGNAYNAGDIYMMDDGASITAERFNAIYEAITAKKTIYSRIVIEDFIAYVFFQAFADENETNRAFTLQNISDSAIISIRANRDALVIVRKMYAIPSKTSELTNDSGFLTSVPEEYVTETELEAKGYLTKHQDISGKEDKYTSATSSSGTVELSDTKMYILGEQSSVTITLPSGAESNGREYLCQFTASADGCTLSVPDTISWLGGETPTINAGKTYQLSIVNNLAVIGEF